jgi:hypothetical protein
MASTEVGTDSSPNSIDAPRNNLEELRQIDTLASRRLQAMRDGAVSIREHAAYVVVCGVKMVKVMNSDLAAWQEFVEPFKIEVKGEDRSFREVASVLFRGLTTELQGHGSLARRTISRDQISRYGAAIAEAHLWFEQGCTSPDKLAERVVKTGGVWAVAKLHAERRAADQTLRKATEPAARAPTIKLSLPVPTGPELVLIFPDGTYKPVPNEMGADIVARMLQ